MYHCEFFVKEGQTYLVQLTAKEPDGTNVIYVKKEKFSNDLIETQYSHIGFEIRKLQGEKDFLLDYQEIWNHEEVLDVLHSDVLYIEKDGTYKEFTLDSREVDEDRKCYVYYGNFSGNSI